MGDKITTWGQIFKLRQRDKLSESEAYDKVEAKLAVNPAIAGDNTARGNSCKSVDYESNSSAASDFIKMSGGNIIVCQVVQ